MRFLQIVLTINAACWLALMAKCLYECHLFSTAGMPLETACDGFLAIVSLVATAFMVTLTVKAWKA